jgi:hypothetical protein
LTPTYGFLSTNEVLVNPPQGGAVTTDVAIQNPTNNPIKLPDTSTIVIGVNEIMPLAGQTSMMMGNTTK